MRSNLHMHQDLRFGEQVSIVDINYRVEPYQILIAPRT